MLFEGEKFEEPEEIELKPSKIGQLVRQEIEPIRESIKNKKLLFLDPQGLRDVALLCLLEEKPATFVEITRQVDKGKEEDQSLLNQLRQGKDKFQEILEKLKLPYQTEWVKREEQAGHYLGYDFYIGRESEKLKRLL